MMGLFPLGIDLGMAFFAWGGIVTVDQFLQRTDFILLSFSKDNQGRKKNDKGAR
jgi:hypothetical protein